MKSCKEYVEHRKKCIKELISYYKRKPVLTIMQIGDNKDSNSYIRGKLKDCAEVGIEARLVKFNEDVDVNEFYNSVKQVDEDESVDGIIVQLPIPDRFDVKKVQKLISPVKDVDGFRVDSLHQCCTPLGVMKYLEYNNIDVSGLDAVVVGRSDIVGKPMAQMLTDKNATVTLCHSKTNSIEMYTKRADLIICAVGKNNLITRDMINPDLLPICIDIGRGDFDYENMVDSCSLITPRIGGTGLLTRFQLLDNTVNAYKIRNNE